MNTPASTPEARCAYLNLKASEKGLSEFNKASLVVFIPKKQIEAVEVKFGSRAERPMLQVILGITLVALGAAGSWMAVNGGLRGMYWGLGCLMFGGIGLICLNEALRKGYYLRVTCSNETRKLIFRGRIEQASLSNFVQSASSLVYRFDENLKDKT
jgi:UDP-N-acetylmuramyl pentapeptide phosphotransferase/UDP-N-acetylglucosamine-1-phosphate transferase